MRGTRVMIDRISSELGDFLRSRRERLEPQALGLARRRRRTPGLRREEVAELAGIGVDWYVRLEQGRAVRPSLATIAGLALALRLDEAERAHLRALARAADRPAFARETVSDALLRLVDNFDQPAYVTGCRWDVLAWNAAAAEIFDFGALPTADRNIVLYVLTHPDARRRFGATWAAEAQRIVAQFRLTNDLWAGDRAFVELLRRVREGCAEFAAWWETHDVRNAPTGRKVLQHPVKGEQCFEYATFQANDDPRLRLVIYTPV